MHSDQVVDHDRNTWTSGHSSCTLHGYWLQILGPRQDGRSHHRGYWMSSQPKRYLISSLRSSRGLKAGLCFRMWMASFERIGWPSRDARGPKRSALIVSGLHFLHCIISKLFPAVMGFFTVLFLLESSYRTCGKWNFRHDGINQTCGSVISVQHSEFLSLVASFHLQLSHLRSFIYRTTWPRRKQN